jgi:DNA polymerase alpha-associated DNA helicase A
VGLQIYQLVSAFLNHKTFVNSRFYVLCTKDNLVERLTKCKLDILRVGHPARVLPTVLEHSLDVRIKTCDEGQLVQDIRQEMDKTLKDIQKAKRAERRALYQEMKALRSELRMREKSVVQNLVKGAHVVLSTLNGAASRVLEKETFDTILIDEASQALEAESWIALLKGKRVILAGDHMQLPPTIKCTGRESTQLETTLIDRLLKTHGPSIKRLLNIQYRMVIN